MSRPPKPVRELRKLMVSARDWLQIAPKTAKRVLAYRRQRSPSRRSARAPGRPTTFGSRRRSTRPAPRPAPGWRSRRPARATRRDARYQSTSAGVERREASPRCGAARRARRRRRAGTGPSARRACGPASRRRYVARLAPRRRGLPSTRPSTTTTRVHAQHAAARRPTPPCRGRGDGDLRRAGPASSALVVARRRRRRTRCRAAPGSRAAGASATPARSGPSAQRSPARGSSTQLGVREVDRDLALGGRGRVGAVDDVLGRARARSRPRIVPGAESSGLVAPIIARTVATAAGPLDHHRDHRAGGDELDELGVERLADVLDVVLGGLLLGDPQSFRPRMRKPRCSKRATISPTSPPLDGVGLDQDECALDVCHDRAARRVVRPRWWCAGRRRARGRRACGSVVAPSRSTGTAARSGRAGPCSGGRRASAWCRSGGSDRKLGSAGLRQYGHTWSAPSRRSIARISSSRSCTSSRYSGGRRIR